MCFAKRSQLRSDGSHGDLVLTVERSVVAAGTLRLRSSAHSEPALVVEVRWYPLRSGSCGGGKDMTSLIKSNNLCLAGGESTET